MRHTINEAISSALACNNNDCSNCSYSLYEWCDEYIMMDLVDFVLENQRKEGLQIKQIDSLLTELEQNLNNQIDTKDIFGKLREVLYHGSM